MISFLLLAGCDPLIETVVLSGTVHDAPGNAGNLVEGAAIITQNRDGEVVGEATTSAAGEFAVDVPAGASFYLGLTAEGYVPTSFSSFAGTSDFSASEGYPWLGTTDWVDEVKATYANCEYVGDEGTIIVGQVLTVIDGIDDVSSWPAFPDAVLRGIDFEVVEHPACYLDDEGVSVAGLEATGGTGDFAVFGLPAGSAILELSGERDNGEVGIDAFDFIAPEGGLLPVYPTPLQL